MKSLIILFLSILSFKSCLQSETDLYVVMDDAYGLQKDDKVKCMGVEVGSVKAVKIVGNKVVADLQLNDDFQPTRESTAKIVPENIFNKKSLVIVPAQSSLPLQTGDTIYAQPSSPVDLIQEALKSVRMDSILLKTGLDSVNLDFYKDSSKLNSLLKKAGELLNLQQLLN